VSVPFSARLPLDCYPSTLLSITTIHHTATILTNLQSPSFCTLHSLVRGLRIPRPHRPRLRKSTPASRHDRKVHRGTRPRLPRLASRCLCRTAVEPALWAWRPLCPSLRWWPRTSQQFHGVSGRELHGWRHELPEAEGARGEEEVVPVCGV